MDIISSLFSKSKKTSKSKKSSKTPSKKSSKTKKTSNSNTGGKSKTDLCSKKYKDKSIRGTPKNWAYNRCVKNSWDRCSKLPPAGYGMYRYFCE